VIALPHRERSILAATSAIRANAPESMNDHEYDRAVRQVLGARAFDRSDGTRVTLPHGGYKRRTLPTDE
jgi:hypothetical protein